MRRTTPGNVEASELLPRRIRRIEGRDPEAVIRILEPLVLERRLERLRGVIGGRLSSVCVMFDSPHDPHNGAAIIRSCEAFGVQALHVIERREKFLVAPSVSKGAEKWVDVHTHPTPESALDLARKNGFSCVAAHADGELTTADLRTMDKVAIILGNERNGIGDDLVAACDARVRVPMRGFIGSLNVSVTAAILLSAATDGRAGDLTEHDRRRLYARGLYFSVKHAETLLAEL